MYTVCYIDADWRRPQKKENTMKKGLFSKDVANKGRGSQERRQGLTKLRTGAAKKIERISHRTGLGGNKRPTARTIILDKIPSTLDHKESKKGTEAEAREEGMPK